ncbi:MAG TPA: branched-chain amino acid ABC transporter permease [Terrimesophilobacter sp.]|nr:branched-chain amino acid ABC transporter permease [Terrimesophilobacter sp.]
MTDTSTRPANGEETVTREADPTRRLTGQSAWLADRSELDRGAAHGTVGRWARNGRPRLFTSYTAEHAIVNTRYKRVWMLILLLVAAAAPFLIHRSLTYLLATVFVFAIAGLGLNLLTGYAGQISIGHAFFMGLGAYTGAVLGGTPGRVVWGLELDLAIVLPLAAIIPGIIGLLVAPIAMRVRGLYLAILTIGLLMLGEQLFKQWTNVSGGQGVGRGVAEPVLFGMDLSGGYRIGPLIMTEQVAMYLLTLVVLVLAAIGVKNLARSRTARAFAAVRVRDIAAEVMGVSLLRTKTLAFALSSALAGLAGALYSMLIGRISPEQWNLFLSIDIIAVVVIGGAATISGSIIGAAFVVLVPKLLEALAPMLPFLGGAGSGGLLNVYQLQTILFGVLIVLFMTLEPRGLFGVWIRIRNYFKAWPFKY